MPKSIAPAPIPPQMQHAPRDAIALCSAFSFDVLISAANMPEIDGHRLVQSVVRQRPAIRCILMSASDLSDCHHDVHSFAVQLASESGQAYGASFE
jgi:CheY-like chemotaxis protein